MPIQKGHVGFHKNSTTPHLINVLLGQAINLLAVAQKEKSDPADRYRALTMAHDFFEQADRRFLECYDTFIPKDLPQKGYEELTGKTPCVKGAAASNR